MLLISPGPIEEQLGHKMYFQQISKVYVALVPQKTNILITISRSSLFLLRTNIIRLSISCSEYFWEAFG